MHIERIHKMIEKLTECALCEIEKGIECVNTEEMGEVIDMIKDLSEAEHKSLISKEMKQYKEEAEAEEKYMMKMLKEDRADEYKHMREQYGDEEGERRFYDNYRYANGRFAPKGRGSYMPRSSGRRGYGEPPYYHMMPEMYDDYRDAEWNRDMDRATHNKMYFTPMTGNMGNSANSGRENMSGDNVRGYENGYRDGKRDGRGKESRYDKARRGYEETKEMHKGNDPESKRLNMQEMEKVLNVVFDEIDEMMEDASPEVKNMVKTKGMSRFQKIQ